MIFTSENTRGGSVFDVDTKQKIGYVRSIDTENGEIVCMHQPIRIKDGEVETFSIRYESIYPIYGGSSCPCLFHCYGLKSMSHS